MLMNSAPAQEDKPHGQWNCWVNGTKCAKNHLKWRWFITLSGVHCVWAWGTRLEEALVIPAWWCLYPKYHPHGALRMWGSITFRKTSLSCNPDCISLEKKHAYTIRKWSLQLFSNTSDKGDSSFPVVAETLKLWVELGVLGVCLHIHLSNFVFPCKIELHTIIPIFGNTLIPCLTLEWLELWKSPCSPLWF